MMRTFSMAAILLVISQPVRAQAPEAVPAPQTREQAVAQRAQAEATRTEAQRVPHAGDGCLLQKIPG